MAFFFFLATELTIRCAWLTNGPYLGLASLSMVTPNGSWVTPYWLVGLF